MRWCSWSPEPGAAGRLGALRERDGEEWLLDVASWAAHREAAAPADLVDLLEAGDVIQRRTTELVLTARGDSPGWLRPAAVRLLAPLRAPNSYRGFDGYGSNAAPNSTPPGSTGPDAARPFFYGNRRAVLGDGDDVRLPSYAACLDYDCQVAAVLGRHGRDLAGDDARAAIFGYVAVNDWTARDLERDELAAALGPAKAKDAGTSFGSVLVTADEWDPDDDHAMTVSVDGEEWSRGSTAYGPTAGRRWTYAELVAYASRDADVYPTDVLASGTYAGGNGAHLGRELVPGQVVTVTVDGLGSVTNRVVR